MALYLADTSAWRRSGATPAIADRWEALVYGGELAICAPIELELLYSARGRRDYETRRSELEGLAWLPIDVSAETLARRAQADLAAASQNRGPEPIDLLIAGVAQAWDATLLHYDRHFDAIARVTGQPMEWLVTRGSLD